MTTTLRKFDDWMSNVVTEEALIRNMAEIIGVAINLKAVAMDLFTPEELQKIDLREFRQLLHQLGIHVIFERRALGGSNPNNVAQYYFLSSTHENAVAAQSLFHKIWSGEWQFNRDIGALLGYPQTAVDYFLSRNEENDTPEDKDRIARNRFYVHSPEHENEEFSAYEQKIYAVMLACCPKTTKFLQTNTTKRLS